MKKSKSNYSSGKHVPFYKRPKIWIMIALCLAAGTAVILWASGAFIVYKAEYTSPSELAAAYKNALLKNDFKFMKAMALPDSKSNSTDDGLLSNDEELRKTTKIIDVEINDQILREDSACYQLDINVEEAGTSAFHTGINPSWLWLKEVDGKWYVEGLMYNGAPNYTWHT